MYISSQDKQEQGNNLDGEVSPMPIKQGRGILPPHPHGMAQLSFALPPARQSPCSWDLLLLGAPSSLQAQWLCQQGSADPRSVTLSMPGDGGSTQLCAWVHRMSGWVATG